jgi:hypothetical protein
MEAAVTVPAYDLRITIQGTEPGIWRRLQVPETITVPELHQSLQVAFGWENRHLYGIRCIDRRGVDRIIIGPDEAAEDIDAEPASGVVLFELLDAGIPGPTTLEYEYDFGDAWTHEFEVLGAATVPEGAMICVDGANRGPVEDSGGPGGFAHLVEVLADPGHAEHEELCAWYKFVTGEDPGAFEPYSMDRTAINARLESLGKRLWPEPPTDQEIEAVVRPVHWLLSRVPTDGLELTKDGYLKPAFVRQIMDELGWAHRWPGSANRESQTFPVLRLRQQLQDWKLVRKLKGRLILAPTGRKMHDGGRPLWDFLAERVALPSSDALKVVTGMVVLWLLDGSTPSWDKRERIIADALQSSGFRMTTGRFIPLNLAGDLYREVHWTLECLQLTVPEHNWSKEPALSDGGRKFLLRVQSLLDD